MAFSIVYITFPSQELAQEIGAQLVGERLAACANIFPIRSVYWWNAVINTDDEWVAIVKTTREGWGALRDRVLDIHPYDVPCIMKIEVEANAAYEDWIAKEVNSKSAKQ